MRRGEMKRNLFILFTVLSLSGCFKLGTQPPAPALKYGLNGGADSAGVHTVAPTDTLWTIAQRYKLSMPDIVYLNNLQAPYFLSAGQRLKLPPPRSYRARAGDTLHSIAKTFSVSQAQLAQVNNLQAPYAVQAGQTLSLPPVQPAYEAQDPVQLAQQEPVSAPLRGSAAIVEVEELAPSSQRGGEEGQVKLASILPAPPAPPPVPARTQGLAGKFIWPVSGPVISGYGPKDGGLHNDGINIKAPKGARVGAAENGTVVYTGDDIKGFGNLVLIKHADRWITAYGHLDRILVRRGQEIARGESIGTVGSTGSVGDPQLHFEIRRGAEALNPAQYLGRTGI